MLKSNCVMGAALTIMLSACSGQYSTPKDIQNAQKTPAPSTQEAWILNSPNPNKTVKTPVPSTPLDSNQVRVAQTETLEQRVARLESEMAALKLDISQIDQRYNLKNAQDNFKKPPQQKIQNSKLNNTKGNIRFGINGDTTRIVVDLNSATKYALELDNQERFLLLTLEGVNAELTSGNGQGLVSNYNVDTQPENATRLILNLNEDVKITQHEALGPSGKYGHRVFIDLIASK